MQSRCTQIDSRIGSQLIYWPVIICLITIFACIPMHALAGTFSAPEIPKPLKSKDLQKWMKDLAPSDAQRVKCEQAFDAYVDQWEQLRDKTIRPAQAKHDAPIRGVDVNVNAARNANEQNPIEVSWSRAVASAYDTIGNMERAMFSAMREAQSNEAQQATVDLFAAARARKRASAVVRGVPLNLPSVPKVPALSQENQAAIDKRSREWELSATPLIERIASASLDDKSADRMDELKRKLITSERAAVRDIAAQLPPDAAQKYKAQFARKALAGLSSWSPFAFTSPDALRKQLADANRAEKENASAIAKIDQWQQQRDQLDDAALDALTAEKFSPEAMQDMNAKFAQMNAASIADIAQAANMPELGSENEAMPFTFEGGDGEGAIDLSELGNQGGAMMFTSVSSAQFMGDAGAGMGATLIAADGNAMPEGAMQGAKTMMVITSSGNEDASNMSVSANVSMNIQVGEGGDGEMTPELAEKIAELVKEKVGEHVGSQVEAKIGDQMNAQIDSQVGAAIAQSMNQSGGAHQGNNGASEIISNDTPQDMFGGMRQFRAMNRQDIEQLRLRLVVPDAQRAVWDSLANDLLQSNAEWKKTNLGAVNAIYMPQPGEDAATFMKKSHERAEALAKLEETWFDDVATGVKGLDAAQVERERGRRAMVRAFANVQNSPMPMPNIMMSRWSKVDLYAAADALPAQERAQIMPTLDACRAQMLQELTNLPDKLDAFSAVQMSAMQMESHADDAGHDNMQISMIMDDSKMAELEKARKPLTAAWKAVEQLQEANVEAVAEKLDASNAALFRRAVRKQTHPEVFRTQEKVDAAIERIIALPALTPAQMQAVTALANDYHQRADTLIARSIEQTQRNDAAMATMMEGTGQAQPADMAKQERAMMSTDIARADASYDREELNARALRQLRAALTADQAKAAKVN